MFHRTHNSQSSCLGKFSFDTFQDLQFSSIQLTAADGTVSRADPVQLLFFIVNREAWVERITNLLKYAKSLLLPLHLNRGSLSFLQSYLSHLPTGPFWSVKSKVRLPPSMLAMLMLSPSVQYSFLRRDINVSLHEEKLTFIFWAEQCSMIIILVGASTEATHGEQQAG